MRRLKSNAVAASSENRENGALDPTAETSPVEEDHLPLDNVQYVHGSLSAEEPDETPPSSPDGLKLLSPAVGDEVESLVLASQFAQVAVFHNASPDGRVGFFTRVSLGNRFHCDLCRVCDYVYYIRK